MATLLTVLSLVTFGARFAVTKGLESKSNRQLAIEMIDRAEAPVLAKRQLNNEPVVLGSSTTDQLAIDANKLAACRVAMTSQIENVLGKCFTNNKSTMNLGNVGSNCLD